VLLGIDHKQGISGNRFPKVTANEKWICIRPVFYKFKALDELRWLFNERKGKIF
jgi:hypothetical protein